MSCLGCYITVEKVIGGKFEQYGGFVARHPWKFIISYVTVTCLLGIGLINLQSESNIETVYTPKNSQASKDRAILRGYYEDLSGSNFFPQNMLTTGLFADILFKTKAGQNILDLTYLNEAETIYSTIYNFTLDHNEKSISYSDLCAVTLGNCYVSGNIVFSSSFKASVSANTVTYPVYNGIVISGVFGNMGLSGYILENATSFRIRYYLRTNSSENLAAGKAWLDKFLVKAKTLSPNLVDIAFAHSESLGEELNANISGDIVFFSVTFTLMAMYASYAVANCKCVSDRQNLAKAAVLSTALAILGALGLGCACGVQFVSIVGVVPFLIIGIGVDDMFLLMSGLAETYDISSTMDPVDRVKKTMRSSGVGITITSLTDLIAFLVGIASPFMAVRNFCIYTAISVFFCYIGYVTFFIACISLNERRVNQNRHCFTCLTISEPAEDGKKTPKSLMCTGKVAKSRFEVEGPLEKYPPLAFSKIVLWTPMKVFIIIAFIAYLCIAIWGATQFEQGLKLNQLVTEDSYYYRYTSFNEDYEDVFPISFNIIGNDKYSEDGTWVSIQTVLTASKADKYIDPVSEINWLLAYRQSGFYDNSSESAFISNLRTQFLPSNPSYVNDISFDQSYTSIQASRFYVFEKGTPNSYEKGKLMHRMREIPESSVLSVIVYTPAFIWYEQYVTIVPNTLQTLGVAMAAIFVVTAIFLPHPILVALVTVTLAMILVGMIGFMHFWDLTISTVTMTHIIMSVGFSVDFSAHICHGFMETAASDRNNGAKGALKLSGGPIFNGALSSIIGVVMLAFSKSFIFFSFFKVMFLIIVLGAAHSILFLPVVLSLIGPQFKSKRVSSSSITLKEKSNSVNNQ